MSRLPGPVGRLLLGHALASLAMSLPWPLLLLLVWGRWGGSEHGDLLLGMTGAARMLPYVALSWATGPLADRFRRDRLLRVTMAARLALLCVMAAAVAAGWLLLAVVAASATVACGTPAYPALAAAMPQAAGDERRRATDLLVTIEVASFVVGPAVGGLLLVPLTRPVLPAVAVALTALGLLLVRRVVLPGTDNTRRTSSARSVVGTARRCAGVARAIGTVAVLNAVLAAAGLALLPLATGLWRGGDSAYGVATGVLGFGGLAAPLLWWCRGPSTRRTRWGLLLMAVALALVPVSPGLGWSLPSLAVVGAAAVHVEAAVTQTVQNAVPTPIAPVSSGLTDSVMVAAALLGLAAGAHAGVGDRPPRAAGAAGRRVPARGHRAVEADRLGTSCTAGAGAAGACASASGAAVARRRRDRRPSADADG